MIVLFCLPRYILSVAVYTPFAWIGRPSVTWYASTDQDGLKTETLLAIYKEPREPRSLVPALPLPASSLFYAYPTGLLAKLTSLSLTVMPQKSKFRTAVYGR